MSGIYQLNQIRNYIVEIMVTKSTVLSLRCCEMTGHFSCKTVNMSAPKSFMSKGLVTGIKQVIEKTAEYDFCKGMISLLPVPSFLNLEELLIYSPAYSFLEMKS